MESLDADERWLTGLAIRREVLGSKYVDAAVASTDADDEAFQAFVVETCWRTCWMDERLTRREHSLVTLVCTAALGRMEEFKLHVTGAYNNGITKSELEALIIQIGAYCGVPAAIAARRAFKTVEPPQD